MWRFLGRVQYDILEMDYIFCLALFVVGVSQLIKWLDKWTFFEFGIIRCIYLDWIFFNEVIQ